MPGYDADDPRPPLSRTLEAVAAGRRAVRERRPRALAGHAGLRSDGRRADDVHEGLVRRLPGGCRRHAAPERARALKTEQEIERMRLANEIAAAAMEHVAAELGPGMKESEAAALWQGFVHGEGTGWKGQVELALGFSLVWSGPGIRTFTATGHRPVQETRADAVRDLGLRGRVLVRPHEERLPGHARRALRRAARRAARRLRTCARPLPPRCEPRRARRPHPRWDRRRRILRPADASDRPRRRGPRTRAAVRASGRRWHDRGRDGSGDRARCVLGRRRRAPVEDNFLITADGAEKLSSYPDDLYLR